MELSNLKRGQIAVISKVKPGELYLILIERGFYPGNKIEFLFSDIFQDMKINNGLDSINSVSRKIKSYKIKAVKRLEDNSFSSEFEAWYDPDSGVVYDFDMKFPIGKVLHENGIPNKRGKQTYIVDQVIIIPKLRKF